VNSERCFDLLLNKSSIQKKYTMRNMILALARQFSHAMLTYRYCNMGNHRFADSESAACATCLLCGFHPDHTIEEWSIRSATGPSAMGRFSLSPTTVFACVGTCSTCGKRVESEKTEDEVVFVLSLHENKIYWPLFERILHRKMFCGA